MRPHSAAIDDWADQASAVLRSGGDLRRTTLGQLFWGATERSETFCLCGANDTENFPEPQSEDEPFDRVAQRLDSDGSWA